MPQNSINSLKKNPFKQLPEENFYDELTNSTISEIYNKIEGYTKKDEKTLLFIDDMTASLKSSIFIETTLKKLVFNRRHLKLNIIITAQSYKNIPSDIRKNIESLVLFKPSKKEFESLFDELFESKKHICLQIMKFAFNIPHNFLFLNVPTQRMFKKWDEIIIKDDSDSDSDDDDDNDIIIKK